MCMMGTNSTQPTLLNSTSGDTQARINSLASRESVSPTSNSMVGVRVESNFTKQYTSASAVAYSTTYSSERNQGRTTRGTMVSTKAKT